MSTSPTLQLSVALPDTQVKHVLVCHLHQVIALYVLDKYSGQGPTMMAVSDTT